jgi:hypothetical protein
MALAFLLILGLSSEDTQRPDTGKEKGESTIKAGLSERVGRSAVGEYEKRVVGSEKSHKVSVDNVPGKDSTGDDQCGLS